MIEYRNKAGQYLLDTAIFNGKNKDLELSFSAVCDKACYYCYLKDFGQYLYPACNKEQILNNLEKFLNYLYEKDYRFDCIDLFSGEFFALSYWSDVLDILLNAKFKNYNRIMIPTNFSFVERDILNDIIDYQRKFIGVGKKLSLSCSIDGENDYETRPYKVNSVFNISNIKDAAKLTCSGFHPMVSPKFLEDYKSNVDFWINTTLEFNDSPMLLEVRNDFWDDEALNNLSEFLYYLAEQFYTRVFNNDADIFAKVFFDTDKAYSKYSSFILTFPRILQRMSCSFQSTVFVRVSDLALIPCHRLSYPQFIYGQFVPDGNSLRFESKNLDFHITATTMNPSSFLPKCANCSIKAFCNKGCLGAQFEVNEDPFIPIESVCRLHKVKYVTLHRIAKKYGLYDIYFNDPLLSPEDEAATRYIVSALNKLEEEIENEE